MKRKIKFRAWAIDHGQMCFPDTEDCYMQSDGDGFTLTVATGSHLEADGIVSPEYAETIAEFMQFTGLLDKNGKEIYEGDIVRWPDGKTTDYIEFKDAAFGTKDDFLAGLAMDASEVIGNIYENPDLLK